MHHPSSHIRRYFLQLALPTVGCLCLLFASCSRVTTNDPDPARVPVDFSLRIGAASTRAVGTQWGVGDAVGVFMLKNGTGLHSDNIIDNADNLRYITTSSGESVNLTPAIADEIMYYPVDGSVVDFLAYYPYVPTGNQPGNLTNHTYPVRVDNQSVFSAIDLLCSRGSGSKSNKTVSLLFSHQLSKFRVVLRKSAGLSLHDLSGTRVDLLNMPLASGFSLSDQTFNYLNPANQQETGVIQTHPISDGVLYEALILPQPADRFKARGVGIALAEASPGAPPYAYRWSIPDGTAFRSGKEYTYTFTLHGNSVEFGGVQINDWEDYSFESTVVEMIDTHTDFLISRFLITNAQYAAFLNSVQVAADGIWANNQAILVPHPALGCTMDVTDGSVVYHWKPASGMDDAPVTSVSWYGAQAFAVWYGGSLPSEAQWEYACHSSAIRGSHIWEWCADSSGDNRVLRGNCSNIPAEDCCSARHEDVPIQCDAGYGFRIALNSYTTYE